MTKSLDFAIHARKQHYHTIRRIWKQLHPLTIYLTNNHEKFSEVDIRIKHNLPYLVTSALNVLRMQDRFLQKVTPTNISYFHFMRRSDMYFNYLAMKYVLEVGNLRKKDRVSVFDDLNHNESVIMFIDIVSWIYHIISYKCSALYI